MVLQTKVLQLTCASARPGTRISGGAPLAPGELPYLVSVQLNSSNVWYHLCGGALISETTVVTAAHCISGSAADYRIVLGEYSLSQDDGTEEYSSVASYVRHPDYNGNAAGFPNDITIVTLANNVNTNNSAIGTIPLADAGADFTGQDCTISGWGSLAGDRQGPRDEFNTTENLSQPSSRYWGSTVPHNAVFAGSVALQDTPSNATFPAISNAACTSLWAPVPGVVVLPSHVCMVGTAGQAACHYDNGGPMVCNGVLVGLISWGDSSCEGTLPSVMASIPYFRNWIDAN
ncbi:chymotrypsin-like serine proteinase [Haliotis rubra]|uniref:chymotrypsin-like serine proteinase n=1 Tax=Haliotis rubra TaxID=36100 RepID=UPI001EE5258E|nr:chymotrypsin-like serine proteinase [Haliotis rubra]